MKYYAMATFVAGLVPAAFAQATVYNLNRLRGRPYGRLARHPISKCIWCSGIGLRRRACLVSRLPLGKHFMSSAGSGGYLAGLRIRCGRGNGWSSN
jgi:hypothetical protein